MDQPIEKPRSPSPQKGKRALLAGFIAVCIACAILAVVLPPILGTIVTVNTTNFTKKGRQAQISADLKQILNVARMRQTERGSWPESIEAMTRTNYENGEPAIARLDKFPKDPWGHSYRYEIVGGDPRVTCLGRDNSEGGMDEDEDIVEAAPKDTGQGGVPR